ncbi:MAG: hypothetical protein WCE75_16290 [Terracidiphilus sp.]
MKDSRPQARPSTFERIFVPLFLIFVPIFGALILLYAMQLIPILLGVLMLVLPLVLAGVVLYGVWMLLRTFVFGK